MEHVEEEHEDTELVEQRRNMLFEASYINLAHIEPPLVEHVVVVAVVAEHPVVVAVVAEHPVVVAVVAEQPDHAVEDPDADAEDSLEDLSVAPKGHLSQPASDSDDMGSISVILMRKALHSRRR